MIDRSVNFLGSTPILGSIAAIATGTALAAKLQKLDAVTAVFFGDGASEEGVVYESMNFAAKFELPVLYVLENNLYAVRTKLLDRRSPAHDPERLFTGLGVEYVRADGNDYVDVHTKGGRGARRRATGCADGRRVHHVPPHGARSAPLLDDAAGYRDVDPPDERLRKDRSGGCGRCLPATPNRTGKSRPWSRPPRSSAEAER
jgi:pyruvate dehydrogenase E1 component alpha subunit